MISWKADPTGEGIRARFEKAVEIRDLSWTPPVKPESEGDGLNDHKRDCGNVRALHLPEIR